MKTGWFHSRLFAIATHFGSNSYGVPALANSSTVLLRCIVIVNRRS